MDNSMSSRPSQGTKLQDRLKIEEIKNVVKHPKQKEELVKFMSKVPSYLEKGENLKEKALNVGVLDFRRLEKWQSHHKTISQQSSMYSPSTSNSSSFFSTDESSSRSSRANSSSPAWKRTHGPSLRSHLISSPKEAYSHGAKTAITENVGKLEDLKASSSNPLKEQQNIFRMYQSFSRNQPGIKLKESKCEDAELKIIPKVAKASLDSRTYGAGSQMKGKQKIQDGESTNRVEECQERQCDDHHRSHQRCKTMVFPRVDGECSHSAEKSRRSISEGSISKEVCYAFSYSDFPHSCPLPCENDNINVLRIKQPNFVDAKSMKLSYAPLQPAPCSVKRSVSPSRGKKIGEKLTQMHRNSTDIKSSEGLDSKKGTLEAPKSRNPSPTRRLINGLGLIGRVSTSKDSSENGITTRGSDKIVVSCMEDSGNSKSTGKSRSQSSPLRRLLDPLLKPKASNSHQFVEPSEKDPSSVDRACKSSTVHPVKAKLDFSGCKSVVVDDSYGKKKQGSSTVQALLRIVIKNGLPLFTFAVEGSSDILAASMRKDEKCWIYTFFTVHELKKKNAWINRGSKDKSRGYVPNAVAQMKVSDSQVHNLARENSADELHIREFVLSSLDLKLEDQHISDLQTNDELAAIVVKIPKGNSYLKSGSLVRSQELLSTTVILPSGVHGQPSKGEPSPLIKRWKLGGICDCGGWDLGCRLRVLANQTKLGKRPSSAKIHCAADRFELFSQGEEGDDMPVFSMSSFKDGILSVEFNSSLSFIQAFSTCIAVLSCRKPYELSDFSKPFEEKSFEIEEIKAANLVQVEVLESYSSYPPVSPIGRV